jgi:hypothetical protein
MSHSTELESNAVAVSDDPSRVDVDVVWQFLSTAACWGRWRGRGVGRQLVEEMVENGPGREFRWMVWGPG